MYQPSKSHMRSETFTAVKIRIVVF